MRYGHFEGREYVITNPHTPVKWINYVGTIDFGGFVDHTGGMLICKGDPALNRITKYITQLPASEFKGSTIYVRRRKANRNFLYSPYYVPTLHLYDLYECRVGLGYSRFIMECEGLRSEITVFVPEGESVVLQDVRIKNIGKDPIDELDIIPVVEYSHFDALKQLTNADWVPQTMTSKAIGNPGSLLILRQCAFMQIGRAENFLTSNWPVSSFETDRKRFLGANEYGTWTSPLALKQKELSNFEPLRGDNIGALIHHLGTLQPGEERRLIIQLGQAESVEKAIPAIERFRKPEEVDAALSQMEYFWENYLNVCQVETPDREFNLLVNTHNPRQCFITLNWSRYLSYYQLGYGERGIGMRDSSQDVMAVVSGAPERAKNLLRKLLSIQRQNGSAMHQFNPQTMEATIGDAQEMKDRPKYYGDDHLWLVFAVCHYLTETGDYTFLEEKIPFYEKGEDGKPLEVVTVLEHLERAVEFTWNNVGAHGIPLLGFADWNDTINLRNGAESFFIAHQFSKACRDLCELMEYLGEEEKVKKHQAYAEEMKKRVNEVGWDGEWYLRYFDYDGTPLGSKQNTKGKIFTNAQSWAVISNNAPLERANKALDAVYTYLHTEYGIKLSTPGYDHYDPNIGGVTTYPPGAKENGGIFLHANPWVIIAECMMRNGERAYQYFSEINPIKKNEIIDIYEVEPYVFCQNILGDEHPQFGLGRNSWLTGTASWMYQAATQYILGVRVSHQGLIIDPCTPFEWKIYTVRKKTRGAWYTITVHNPSHVSEGVRSCTVNNETVPLDNGRVVIPFAPEGSENTVEVVLGQ